MQVFITGGTGYLGRPLIERLLRRGIRVRALVRPGSERKVPAGAEAIIGDPLSETVYRENLTPADTVVHLLGTPKPAPWKGREFREVDQPAALAAVCGATANMVGHFIYVSVAHPAPIMKAYIQVRQNCERALEASGLPATILRPWYVLGPGHWWPYLLVPVYKLLETCNPTRERALQLGLVSHEQMLAALEWSIVHPNEKGSRVLDVPRIRELGKRG